MNGEVDLRASLKILGQRKRFIFGGTLGCVILAVIIAFLCPKTYRSSLILEIGEIYLSSQRWKQEMQYIEEPAAVAEVIESEGILDMVRKKLGLKVRLQRMKNCIAVTTFEEGNRFLPVLEVAYQGDSPREAVTVLESLAEVIINRHNKKYGVYRKALESNIKYIQEKIVALEKIIGAQSRYQQLCQSYRHRDEENLDDFLRELKELRNSEASPVEILFLQTSSLTEKQHVTKLTEFSAELELKIANNEKEIADSKMQIADLSSRIELSSPTEIRAPAVFPERHFRPRRSLIVALGGILGLALMALVVLFRDYLKE